MIAMNKSINILLVEDLVAAQKVAVHVLIHLGHRVLVAKNSKEALDTLITRSIDLILLDLDLPDISGFSIAETIRSVEKVNKHKIIIALTAHASSELPGQCRRFGIDDYMIKPLSDEKARYTLFKYFSLSSQEKIISS